MQREDVLWQIVDGEGAQHVAHTTRGATPTSKAANIKHTRSRHNMKSGLYRQWKAGIGKWK